ncbi:MAG: hypothetical protein HY038_03520 [Nitrospirae bacterium]|nr:hypothetical protein [Nitrospirota bacterium]
MSEDVLYSWLGGKSQREKQSGYITREKQKEQIQHVLSIGLPLLTNQRWDDLAVRVMVLGASPSCHSLFSDPAS